MKKSVLIISGSPRLGSNSDILCNEFMRGAKESGHEVEKIQLREKKIGFCIACEACQTNGGKCFQKDDVSQILDQMVAADVIVLATPVYFYTMDAQIKALIDRTVAQCKAMVNKSFYFIISAADPDKKNLERTIDGLRGFTDCLPEAKESGVVIGSGAWAKGEIQGNPAMSQAYELGKLL